MVLKFDKLIIFLIALCFLGVFVYLSFPFVHVIVYALFLFYVARPIHRLMGRLFFRRRSTTASFIAITVCLLPIMLLAIYTVGIAQTEFVRYASSSEHAITIPEPIMNSPLVLESRWYQLVYRIRSDGLSALTAVDFSELMEIGKNVLGIAVDILVGVFLVLVLAFFMLRDGRKLTNFILKTVPKRYKEKTKKFLKDADIGLNAIFFGSIVNAIMTGLLAVGVFYVLNRCAPNPSLVIPYATLIGVLIGMASLIPLFGIKLVWIPLFVYLVIRAAAVQFSASVLLYLLAFLVLVNILVDFIPEQVIRPFVAAKKVHTGLLLFSYIAGAVAFGPVGIFIAPVLLVFGTSFMNNFLP